MKRTLYSTLAVMAATLLMAGSAMAATQTVPVTIGATVSGLAKLTIPAAVSFPGADPDVTASIPASANPYAVTAKVRTTATGAVSLTAQTTGDLTNGVVAQDIPIANVTWTATGAGFAAGTMNKTIAQSAGAWTGSGTYTGSYSYFFANSWSYVAAAYTATANYILTAP